MDTSERKRTEGTSGESEERYRTLFELIDDGFCVVQILLDPEGEPADYRFLDCNPAFEEHTGLRDPVGKTALEMVPTLDRWWIETYGRIALTGEPARFENHAAAMGRRWFEVYAFRFGSPEDRQVAIFFKNITERKRAEARDHFLVRLDDAVRPLTDPQEITRASARLLGEHLDADRCAYADVEADEDTFNLTGDYNRGVPSIVGRYTFTAFGAEVLRLMRANQPYVVDDIDTHEPPPESFEAYRRTMIQAVVCVPLHKAGRFVAAMAVHQKTPRRWTADEVELVLAVANRCWESIERARVARVARTGEEQLRLIMASVKDHAILTMDTAGRVTTWNAGAERMFGYTAGEILGRSAAVLFTPEDQRNHRAETEMRRAAGEGMAENTRNHLRKDGSQFFASGSMEGLRDEAGNLHGFVQVIRDISEQRRIEQQRDELLEAERRARAEAERVGRMKDEFLATLSHELRTPLNAILGWAHLLSRGKRRDEAMLGEGLAVIERNAKAQAKLVEDLLDMSRIISGKVRLDVQSIELPPVIDAGLDAVRPAAEAKEIRLVRTVDPHAGPVMGDPNRLQQILWNLLTNAVKFTSKGGQVHVVLERVNSHVELSVTDTGQGVHPDFLPHVFERFQQADASTTRRHGGLGLGLAIVKHLTELHGGTVRVQSAGEGQGSTFTVALPLVAVQSPAHGLAEERRDPQGGVAAILDCGGTPLAGLRVLIVDDEPDARSLIRQVLEECKARVDVADSAAEALALLDQKAPDILVSDIGMPKQDGYELIRRVRSLPAERGGAIPAIALTAFARSEDRQRALIAGYQMHISKPVEPAELVAGIRSLTGLLRQL